MKLLLASLFPAFLTIAAAYAQVINPGAGGGGGGSGTVTSVGFTGGLVSVATPTTTPALTVAGTSGGIPYFSGAATWASSAALTANGVLKGGGAGVAPLASGCAIDGSNNMTCPGSVTSGSGGGTTGAIDLSGATSGVVTLSVNDAAGTWVLKLPATAGTNGYAMTTDGTGVTAWTAVGLTANPLSQFAATTSAQLAGVLSDETGTSLAVFNTSPLLVTPKIGTINDTNGLGALVLSPTASAVDQLTVVNGATGNPGVVQLQATGTDTNVSAKILPKGTGIFNVGAGTLPSVSTGEAVIYRTGTPTGIVIAGQSTQVSPTTDTDGVFLGLMNNAAGNRVLLMAQSSDTINSTSTGLAVALSGTNVTVKANSVENSTAKPIIFGQTGSQTQVLSSNPLALTGHIAMAGSAPTIASGFGTTPALAGVDASGVITVGSGGIATTGVITFNATWANRAPQCYANDQTTVVLVQAVPTTTTLTLTALTAFGAADKINWFCTDF